MSFLCYVNDVMGGVPYFQVLPECSAEGAMRYAAALLREHDGETADVWLGERFILQVSRADLIRMEAERHIGRQRAETSILEGPWLAQAARAA
jgi:hypothetical protein